MSEQLVFINLPVSDLERAKRFYQALGCEINLNFTDDNAACVVWSESVFFMILRTEFMQTFTKRPIADPSQSVGVMTALSRASRDAVDDTVNAGVGAGGTEPTESTQDLGFMYSRQLEDPDGNILEFVWMDPAAAAGGPDAADSAGNERLAEFGG